MKILSLWELIEAMETGSEEKEKFVELDEKVFADFKCDFEDFQYELRDAIYNIDGEDDLELNDETKDLLNERLKEVAEGKVISSDELMRRINRRKRCKE